MTQPLPFDRLRTLEIYEAAAWADYYLSASGEVVELNGLEVQRFGSAVASIAAKIDVLAHNRVVGLGVDEPVDDALLDQIIETFACRGVKRFFVQLAPFDGSDDLARRLLDRGFRHHNNWMKLQRNVAPRSTIPTDLRVERIGSDTAQSFAEVVVDSFEWPRSMIPWIAAPVGRDGWHHYMAYDGDTPVATAAMFLKGATSWIDFAATLSAARGRGAQSALVARRIARLRRIGMQPHDRRNRRTDGRQSSAVVSQYASPGLRRRLRSPQLHLGAGRLTQRRDLESHMQHPTTLLEEALESWEDARFGYIDEVRNIPASQWDYHPTPDVKSVRELTVHVLEVAMMMTGELTREDTNFQRVAWPKLLKMYAGAAYRAKTRGELLRLLKWQLRDGQKSFRTVGEVHMLQHIARFDGSEGTRLAWLHHGIAQEMYHRGQVTLYARLLGIEPALTRRIRGGS